MRSHTATTGWERDSTQTWERGEGERLEREKREIGEGRERREMEREGRERREMEREGRDWRERWERLEREVGERQYTDIYIDRETGASLLQDMS